MVAPNQLHQSNVRVRQATRQDLRVFGGLGTVLSGDFLQLPPVDRGSLAMPPRAIGSGGVEETDEDSGDEEAQGSGEAAQG